MSVTIRGLTFAQPVASAMIFGGKWIENRTWSTKVPEGGLYVAVHAGKAWWKLEGDPGTKPDPKGIGFVAERWAGLPMDLEQVPLGAYLGVVRISRVLHLDTVRARVCEQDDRGQESHPLDVAVARSPWALGTYCWVVDRVWALPLEEPIPGAGGQGLWYPARKSPEACAKLTQLVESSAGVAVCP